ncbi:MAG TPA: hypothetical protein ENK19_07935, partial [Acidobacteria bacterium]|nr:hypothetical protein [Acidobacteriota bacterium]
QTSFGPAGGTGTVQVTADNGCSWNATTTEPTWLHITGNGSGSGSGSFTFTVDKYTGTDQRSGYLNVKGKTVKINQSGVSKGDFLVSAAANIPGEKGTHWQTDLCIFNPNGDAQATVHVLFLPEAISGPAEPVDLTPQGAVIHEHGTLCLADVLASESDSKGALRVQVENPELLDIPVVVTSRTYTKQPDGEGTYGQNVPGQVVSTGPVRELVIGGLQHYTNEDGSGYRTAVGLVNQTDKAIGGINIYIYTNEGTEIGPYRTGVFANGFVQIDRIVEKILGSGNQLHDFSVVIRFADADGNEGVAKQVSAYASIVDNVTGDAVFIPATPVP